MLTAKVERRLALPLDQWKPVGDFSEVMGKACARLARLRQKEQGRPRDAR